MADSSSVDQRTPVRPSSTLALVPTSTRSLTSRARAGSSSVRVDAEGPEDSRFKRLDGGIWQVVLVCFGLCMVVKIFQKTGLAFMSLKSACQHPYMHV